MQDQDAPPVVEEGETGGGVAVVQEADLRRTGVISTVESTPHPWTTVIAQRWAATMARGQDAPDPDLLQAIPSLNLIPCRFVKTQLPVFLVLLMIFSSKPKFRRPRAS